MKGWEGMPLIKMEKKEEEVRFRIQSTYFEAKPKERRMDFIYAQLSLSKDLERYNLKIILGVSVL